MRRRRRPRRAPSRRPPGRGVRADPARPARAALPACTAPAPARPTAPAAAPPPRSRARRLPSPRWRTPGAREADGGAPSATGRRPRPAIVARAAVDGARLSDVEVLERAREAEQRLAVHRRIVRGPLQRLQRLVVVGDGLAVLVRRRMRARERHVHSRGLLGAADVPRRPVVPGEPRPGRRRPARASRRPAGAAARRGSWTAPSRACGEQLVRERVPVDLLARSSMRLCSAVSIAGSTGRSSGEAIASSCPSRNSSPSTAAVASVSATPGGASGAGARGSP